jgi:hypothetical protein
MSQLTEDPIARGLAELPRVPIDPAAAEAVRRRARIELIESGSARPSWPVTALQGVLLTSGAVHAWFSLVMIARIFGSA